MKQRNQSLADVVDLEGKTPDQQIKSTQAPCGEWEENCLHQPSDCQTCQLEDGLPVRNQTLKAAKALLDPLKDWDALIATVNRTTEAMNKMADSLEQVTKVLQGGKP